MVKKIVAIFETVDNGKSIIKGLSQTQIANIHEQMNDPNKLTITVTEYDEEMIKDFTNIFLKQNIVKITMFDEE